VRNFVRQKTIDCGESYREIDIYNYSMTQKEYARRKRSKKEKISSLKQRDLNDKNAKRYFTQLGNLNFGDDKTALHTVLTYNDENLPSTIEEAENIVSNYLRRVNYRRIKEGLPALKYILVTAYRFAKDGETPVRIHHHIIMNGGLPREMVEDMWTNQRINWNRYKKDQEYRNSIKHIGYVNADRLQSGDTGITPLCVYLASQPGGKKRWSSSRNLKRPEGRNNDTRYSKREVEKIIRNQEGREFWEKKYPGWTLTDDTYGKQYEHNEITGWAIYLKLRRIRQ